MNRQLPPSDFHNVKCVYVDAHPQNLFVNVYLDPMLDLMRYAGYLPTYSSAKIKDSGKYINPRPKKLLEMLRCDGIQNFEKVSFFSTGIAAKKDYTMPLSYLGYRAYGDFGATLLETGREFLKLFSEIEFVLSNPYSSCYVFDDYVERSPQCYFEGSSFQYGEDSNDCGRKNPMRIANWRNNQRKKHAINYAQVRDIFDINIWSPFVFENLTKFTEIERLINNDQYGEVTKYGENHIWQIKNNRYSEIAAIFDRYCLCEAAIAY